MCNISHILHNKINGKKNSKKYLHAFAYDYVTGISHNNLRLVFFLYIPVPGLQC
jgi:hypothetical protein